MTSPRIVVYSADRPFRAACDAQLRAAGARVRVASRQTELAKAIGEGTITVIIAGDADHDADVVRATSADRIPVMQRAPGESIGEIVARALAVAATPTNQPRSSE